MTTLGIIAAILLVGAFIGGAAIEVSRCIRRVE